MPLVINKCCFWFNLETGVTIIAVLGILSGYVTVFQDENRCLQKSTDGADAQLIGEFVDTFILVIINCLLLISVYRKIIWIYTLYVVLIALHIIYLAVVIINGFYVGNGSDHYITSIGLLIAGAIWIYFALVVWALRGKQITEKGQQLNSEP